MLQFWKNPEFIRHRRSELRRGRATAVGLVVALVCVLTILACWASEKSKAEYSSQETIIVGTITEPAQAAPQSDSSGPVHRDSRNRYLAGHHMDLTAHEAYGWLLLMQFGVLTFWSLLSGAEAISRERERGTWDFQRTTRLSPATLLIGKLLGEPVLAYFIVLCSLPITLA